MLTHEELKKQILADDEVRQEIDTARQPEIPDFCFRRTMSAVQNQNLLDTVCYTALYFV